MSAGVLVLVYAAYSVYRYRREAGRGHRGQRTVAPREKENG